MSAYKADYTRKPANVSSVTTSDDFAGLRKLVKRDLAGEFAYAQPVAYGPQPIQALLASYDASQAALRLAADRAREAESLLAESMQLELQRDMLQCALARIERMAGLSKGDHDDYYRISHAALETLLDIWGTDEQAES